MIEAAAWAIALLAIACVITRPKGWPEAVWACGGAALLVLAQCISPGETGAAIGKGLDVYLFLAGMMLLAEVARQEGVFEWLASVAARASRGSAKRLFTLIYAVGILVTVFLSNDATAVVLTPAIYAVVKRARAEAMPYLVACAMIANAASFVLPVSNPANLVLYGEALPRLMPWLRQYALPSVASIGVTFAMLRVVFAKELSGRVETGNAIETLSPAGRRAVWGIVLTGIVLIGASATGRDLGAWTLGASLAAVLVATRLRGAGEMVRGVQWSVLPLVAGLFVIVEALEKQGGRTFGPRAIEALTRWPEWAGALASSFGVAALSNVLNNLPGGLLTAGALAAGHAPDSIRRSLLIGVDLGPNLSVTGSLATILWLVSLRRDGAAVSGWQFLRVGFVVMPAALLAATLAGLL